MVFGEIKVDFKELEDGVLLKSDGLPTYNFANVVDDKMMEINFVMRGVEYLSSTPKYNHIYDVMGWERPYYIHLQPIMKDSSQKLSKRHGAASYEEFINKGFLKEAIVNYIALLGWSPKDDNEKFSLAELQERLSIEGLSKSPSIFDEVKMRYINSLYIKQLTAQEYHKHAVKFYQPFDYLKGYDLEYLSVLLHSRTDVFSDVGTLTEFLIKFDDFDLSAFDNDKWKTNIDAAKEMLPFLIELVSDADKTDFENIQDKLEKLALDKGYKKGQVLWVFRIALTGAKNTPGGAGEMARLLGKNRTMERLKATLKRLA